MRTVTETYTVYQFGELSPEARERAIEWYRRCLDSNDYMSDDYLNSLKEFCAHYGGRLRNWSFGGSDRGSVSVDWRADYDEILNGMTGGRLWRYLRNTFPGRTGEKSPMLDGVDFILAGADGACPFTGMCTDCPLFDPLAKFVRSPNSHTTLGELLDDCIESFLSAVKAQGEYAESDACAIEAIEANEYEFLESGELA